MPFSSTISPLNYIAHSQPFQGCYLTGTILDAYKRSYFITYNGGLRVFGTNSPSELGFRRTGTWVGEGEINIK